MKDNFNLNINQHSQDRAILFLQWLQSQWYLGFAIPCSSPITLRFIVRSCQWFAYPITMAVSLKLSFSHKCSLGVEVLTPTDSMFIEMEDF